MDDKNTETTTTTDSTVKAPQALDSNPVADSKPVTDSNPVADSKPVAKESTPTTMGGGENTNMANDTTTKKVDPKFEGCQTYTVVKGDELVDIADKFGVGLNQLRYFNGVPKATFKISEGQTIYIPKGEVKVPVGA
ncbi:LysM peptidoglycan-binding domain-containing protein [Lactobacillus delbrueckii subsp. lactis]|uniref:LysM peptidoglycan-binding domain-containing protein n=1 Tax=Lactobacillus delbrueckii TaxID=1584 RepID=UPI001E30CC27|nr:LysM domain-containing protein [Lactobacillus delbrueckii]MCD5528917.1 LysM peptidoglycan-binding domain-containing protein [Lactobacillus delbrueckii subsp. lactis]MCS8607340.1 LysM peptidoglycan-binding domain-containing protein [Lactobacillus delbrueckii subsp. lactis]